ncbi:MAG: hypothetical protein JWO42_2378 [Chloroflexi bacterium]|nr:hypothetical protein [Chloroflexota bacterium]
MARANSRFDPHNLAQVFLAISHAARIGRNTLVLVLVMLCAVAPAARHAQAASASQHPAALSDPPFTGPTSGAPGPQAALGTDFAFTCNVQATQAPVQVAGMQVATGAGIVNIDGCGMAYLNVSVPAAGHFVAKLALDDAATVAGTAPLARVFVVGPGGYVLHTLDASTTKGVVKQIDVDAAGALLLAIAFPNAAKSYLFGAHLTGSGLVRTQIPLSGSGAPAGASPVTSAQEHFECNAHIFSEVRSVSRITIPTGKAIEFTSCGKTTVQVPSGSTGTLAMRVGASDVSEFTSVPMVFVARVLDSGGHLLRKSVGLVFQGGGLQPFWVNVTGGATVVLTHDSARGYLEVVGLSYLPTQYKLHPNPDHHVFGSPTGGPVSIVPEAFADSCNANPGTTDITVHNQAVLRETYIYGNDCGVTSLIMTNAAGRFHALLGVDDASGAGKTASAKVTVLDQNARPLFTSTVRNAIGMPGVPIDVSITGASIVKLEFSGVPVLYDMRMTGHATLYDRVFPPSEPPVVIHGGVPVNPTAFTVGCNTHVSKQDFLMIHAAALEQWTLDGQGCGTAVLNLKGTHFPHHAFGGLFGLAAADQRYKLGHVQLEVLGANGKPLRTLVLVAREGYGPRRFLISLDGGSSLRMTWPDQIVKIFAMTLA